MPMFGLWTLAQARALFVVTSELLYVDIDLSLKQAFLLQAGVMFANGLAVLNNERFLEKSECISQQHNSHRQPVKRV